MRWIRLALVAPLLLVSLSASAREKPGLWTILGKSFGDPAVQKTLDAHATEPMRVTGRIEDRFYRTWDADGFEIISSLDDRIHTVFLHTETENTREYRGAMPRGLRFDETRAIVMHRLGVPACRGGGAADNLSTTYDIFRFEGSFVHVEYDQAGRIVDVTLIAASDSVCRSDAAPAATTTTTTAQ